MTSSAFLILTRRYGGDTRDPSNENLANAIRELFVEDLPGMIEDDYAEHGAASLRYGWDEGPMFVVRVDRRGTVTFEEWADQDYEHELAPPRTLRVRFQGEALQLWALLASGDVNDVRHFGWDPLGA